MFFDSTETLLDGVRKVFEVSPAAMKTIRTLPFDFVWQPLVMIRPDTAFGTKKVLTFEEIQSQAKGVGLVPPNPLSVLCWAIFGFNKAQEHGEIGFGMDPADGHYLAFFGRGSRTKPRLVRQPQSVPRKYSPSHCWIFST
jgi:hypothetical protein